MAEAIVNSRHGSRWYAESAGTHPAGFVHPMVPYVLAESGIQHQGRSKGLDEVRGLPFDLIVTLCDDAAQECPVWPGGGTILHHGYEDPSLVPGSEEARRAAFRQLRDSMLKELPYLLERHEAGKMQ
jgi:arsenate reductase (thioredoxin)